MNKHGDLYVSEFNKNEIRQWKVESTSGIIVAGGNREGDHLNQLHAAVLFSPMKIIQFMFGYSESSYCKMDGRCEKGYSCC